MTVTTVIELRTNGSGWWWSVPIPRPDGSLPIVVRGHAFTRRGALRQARRVVRKEQAFRKVELVPVDDVPAVGLYADP